MLPVEMSVETGAMLGPVGTERTLELGLDSAFVLQVTGKTRVIVVELAAVATGIGDPLLLMVVVTTHRTSDVVTCGQRRSDGDG